MQSSHEFKQQPLQHAILTCYDGRIDQVVEDEVSRIRAQSGKIVAKDILRPPGGVHMLAGKTDCRKAFYEMITGLRDIAKTTVFHLFPHTNCQYCGIHLQEKLGSGAKSDLRFHLRSAEKMLDGAMNHFKGSTNGVPVLDVRIILTVDQRIVTIDEAHALLPHVPSHSHHGAPCLAPHPPEHQYPPVNQMA